MRDGSAAGVVRRFALAVASGCVLVAAAATAQPPATVPPPAAAATPAATASPAPTPGATRMGTRAAPTPSAAECESALGRLESEVRADSEDLIRGSDYRRAVIECGAYDRAVAFFTALLAERPRSPHLQLNAGYAYVDEIPSAGAITRVILANTAVEHFTSAVELEPSWLALYTRGNSYLYWPKVFGRAPLAVADLERAVALAKADRQRPYHVRSFIALGDAYWKVDEPEKARATWEDALRRFPGNAALTARLAHQGDELAALIEADLDPEKRVDTDLTILASAP
jgi:tetratricopeptide (TPR) repeat protein